MLDTLAEAGKLAAAQGITLAFETGQETADLLRLTLDELKSPNLKVNFDPANMLLYDMGDPIRAVEILGPDIRSVHVKDASRPTVSGQWGEEVPLGQGEVNIREFVQALKKNGYTGPLVIEREVGDQAGRLRDVAADWLCAIVCESDLAKRPDDAVTDRPGSCRHATIVDRERPLRAAVADPRSQPDRTGSPAPDAQFTTELTTWASWRPASVRA